MLKAMARVLALAVTGLVLLCPPARACSIFFSADADNAFFGNNEDGENGNTYLWFVPATRNTYGAVFFSYEDAWVQGGMNERGLALDWAATEPQQVAIDSGKVSPRGNLNRLYVGNLNETILKTCASVNDVIALYRRYNEIAFYNAHILVADKSGASAILEWHDGKFEIIPKAGLYQAITNFNITNSQTQGYACSRYDSIRSVMEHAQSATMDDAKRALRAASDYLTQYSYILDLRKGTILLYDKRNFSDEKTLVLQDELSKPAHIETTGLDIWRINPRYRQMGPINNQNPLAVGAGRVESIVICSLFAALTVLMLVFVRKNRIYALPALSNIILIVLALGLMKYGYFLRYGFTFPEKVLLVLPIAFCALAAAQVVFCILALLGRKGKLYIPLHVNALLSILMAVSLSATVLI